MELVFETVSLDEFTEGASGERKGAKDPGTLGHSNRKTRRNQQRRLSEQESSEPGSVGPATQEAVSD